MGNNNLRKLGAGGNDLAGHESSESLSEIMCVLQGKYLQEERPVLGCGVIDENRYGQPWIKIHFLHTAARFLESKVAGNASECTKMRSQEGWSEKHRIRRRKEGNVSFTFFQK